MPDIKILLDSKDSPWLFGILVERYQEAFLRKASYILGSQDEAEDAVQDTFLKIYKYGERFQTRENAMFSSWAYKILTNTCYTHLAKRRSESMDLDVEGELDRNVGNNEVSLVHSVLERLPKNLSRLLSLRFLEGKNYEEIAVIEHTTLSAVKSGLYRAKKQFKDTALELQ